MDPREGETEEPFPVGRWRQQKEPDEPHAAVEKERINEYKPQKMPLIELVAVEALEANEVSYDELETEYHEAMAVPTDVKRREAGKPPAELGNTMETNAPLERRSPLPWPK